MLIIFDLDDTLIDTSGVITPFKLKQCLKRFVSGGLHVTDFEKAYEHLLSINEKSTGSQDALEAFLKSHHGKMSLLDQVFQEMTCPLPNNFLIPTTPNAKEVLKELSQKHIIALVTGGYPPFQLEKLEKAGIDRAIFSKIAIPEDSIKKPFYEGCMKEFSIPADQVVVCGDRIATDLAPAFELGCMTVHMRWGRGKKKEKSAWVHAHISDLSELKRMITI